MMVLQRLAAPWRRRRHGLAGDAGRVAFWQAARIGGQSLWVILIARLLGPQGYGAFVGVAGLATALGGFTGLGLGLMLLQDVARDPTLFDRRWSQAIGTSVISGAVMACLFGLLAPWVLAAAVPVAVVVAIGFSELLFFPLISVAAFAFSARGRMGTAAALPALMAAGRMLAALAFWALATRHRLETYVWMHVAATISCALIALVMVRLQCEPRPSSMRLRRAEVSEGLGFSIVWMVGNALGSLDKTLVLRLAGAEIAGLYAAAYRFATVLALPIEALTMAAGPRLFRHGGGQKQPGLIARLAFFTLGYSALAGVALWWMAGLLPWLLGETFRPAVAAARWMVIFVPCYGMRLLGSNILMASNAKTLRAVIEATGLGCLFVFALLWLPLYGLYGAIAMICASEGLLAFSVWLALWRRALGSRCAACSTTTDNG